MIIIIYTKIKLKKAKYSKKKVQIFNPFNFPIKLLNLSIKMIMRWLSGFIYIIN